MDGAAAITTSGDFCPPATASTTTFLEEKEAAKEYLQRRDSWWWYCCWCWAGEFCVVADDNDEGSGLVKKAANVDADGGGGEGWWWRDGINLWKNNRSSRVTTAAIAAAFPKSASMLKRSCTAYSNTIRCWSNKQICKGLLFRGGISCLLKRWVESGRGEKNMIDCWWAFS